MFLARVPGLSAVRAASLAAELGSAELVVKASAESLAKFGIKPKVRDFITMYDYSIIEQDLAVLNSSDTRAVYLGHPDYPKLLAEIYDPPLVIFMRGRFELLSMPQVAIVGSRSSDKMGMQTAFQFARFLSQNGFTITSGIALGIDASAHKGALKGTSGTIAVLGTGLDRIYPSRNKELAYKIAEHGLLVTEFGANIGPLPANFPRRNRIISGLALGTLVVQAAVRSGSLVTARTAMEAGREVFAIPGSIHNPLARGCHHLIKQGVKLVETAEDIVTELGGMLDYSRAELLEDKAQATVQDKFLGQVSYDPMLLDDLARLSGLDIAVINAKILELEVQGLVETLPGGRVQKLK
jgi:DNA processing protein